MARMVVTLLVLLAGCVADLENRPPPPYSVFLVDVPDWQRRHWELVVETWNAQVGSEVLVLASSPPAGACGVYVREGDPGPGNLGRFSPDPCEMRIVYGHYCVAAHELGHALGLPDTEQLPPQSVMYAADCPLTLPNEQDGQAVRDRWGL